MRVFDLWREITVWPQAPQGTVHDYVLGEGPLPDASEVAAYLMQGQLLCIAGCIRFDDEITGEPIRGEVGVRTDGEWQWPSQLAHYVWNRSVTPPPDLLAHIRQCGYRPRPLSDEEVRECCDALMAHRSGGSLALPPPMCEALQGLIAHLARPGGPLAPDYAKWAREFVESDDPCGAWGFITDTLTVDAGSVEADDRERLATFARHAGYRHFVEG